MLVGGQRDGVVAALYGYRNAVEGDDVVQVVDLE